MRKRITVLVAALMLALTMSLGSVAAFAAPDVGEDCQKIRGTIYCTEEGKNPKFTQETSKKGSFQSSHEEEDLGCSEANPGNSCPRGQFE